MPFTFSHPAIVLPLFRWSKGWLSLTGLVVGSMTPDFEYFMRQRIHSSVSHTLPGLFWFDIPLGLLLTFVFHNVVRNSLYDHLPLALERRVIQYKAFDWNNYFKTHWWIVMLSVFIGASTHLIWDAFTHNSGYFVKLIPFLRIHFEIFDESFTMARVFQYISTFAGAIAIALVVYAMPQSAISNDLRNSKYWPTVLLVALIFISLRLWIGIDPDLSNVVVTLISAVLAGLIVTPLLLQKKPN